jgi:hypothetical protein
MRPAVRKAGVQCQKKYKKKVHWQTTFGKISVEEQTYYQKKGGSLLRPFLLCSQTLPRGYSQLLQRRITDFGADMAFGRVNEKLEEHYGIRVPGNGIRRATLHHASEIKIWQEKRLGKIESRAKGCVISETDGSMVPIVKTSTQVKGEKVDRRKGKSLCYQEARLTLAHEQGSVTPIFSGTLGSVKAVGKHVLHCVKAVGINKQTRVHCVGDGAVWIADQVEEQFGTNATYLIDFYHVCEYLAAASLVCAEGKEKVWMEEQKALLKNSESNKVLLNLVPFLEPNTIPDTEASVRACYRYIKNRPNQLDYKKAIEKNLPIGSGEIESAHRYLIQKRLKIAGAWWLEDNAENMLALRINRQNNQWNEYWSKAA